MYHDDATVDASTYKQQFAMCIMLVNPRRTVGAVQTRVGASSMHIMATHVLTSR